MVTHSVLGALPLGIIITSDEKTETLIEEMELFKSALPANAFFGNGPATGPRVIMTDNCLELRDAILQAWPETTHVLCIFHILQQVWRWLHDKKNAIAQEDRPFILLKFKAVLYAQEEEDMDEKFTDLLDDAVVRKYPRFERYIKAVFTDRNMWALCYRKDLPLSGNNTNNFCESQFLVLKDEVLNRQKEVNVVALIDKLTNQFDNHYQNKLLSVASGKFDGFYSRRFKGLAKRTKDQVGYQIPSSEEQNQMLQDLQILGENTFLVKSSHSSNGEYLVDMNSGMCQCPIGSNGAACKHQYVLWAKNVANTSNFLPIFDKEERMKFAKMAIGESLALSFYEGLHERVINVPSPNVQNEQNQDKVAPLFFRRFICYKSNTLRSHDS